MKRTGHGKGADRKVIRDFGSLSGAAFGSSGGVSSLSYLGEIPSFSEINDPNVVVALKNLLKKDETTRVRALEDLVRHAQAHPFENGGGVDDALLDIWTQLYPRISIENARRVRELAHQLQHELIKSARKRVEKFIPRVVGAWLAGLYDRDRVVARAANNGLGWFLDTKEKASKFWRKCQLQILDFAIKAGQETAETLSDERTTTVEDSKAKYYRVAAARLSLMLALLHHLQDVDIETSRARFDDYFAQGLVWQYVTSEDAHVRRCVCKLLCACLTRHLPYARDVKARQAFITGAFKLDQTGSIPDFLKALLELTREDPLIWIPEPSQKRPPISRLLSFVAKGSRGSSTTFWESMDPLMAALPRKVWDLDTSLNLCKALKDGLLKTVDFNASPAAFWTCYYHASVRCLETLAEQDQLILAEKELFPVFREHIFQDSKPMTRAFSGFEAAYGILCIHNDLMKSPPHLSLATENQWRLLQVEVCQNISNSFDDEAHGTFRALQAQIGEEGVRWSSLIGLLHNKFPGRQDVSKSQTPGLSTKIINQCLETLRECHLRAFGAVQALDHFLSACPHLFTSDVRQRVGALLLLSPDNMPSIFDDSHSRFLFSALQNFGCLPDNEELYGRVWQTWINAAIASVPPPQLAIVLKRLVEQQRSAPSARSSPLLQNFIRSHVHDASSASADAADEDLWKLVIAAFANQALDTETYRNVINDITLLVSQDCFQMDALLEVLEEFAQKQPDQFAAEKMLRTALVAHLLRLSELDETDDAAKSKRLRSILDAQIEGSESTKEILQSSIRQASSTSIEISTLVAQAKSTMTNPTDFGDFLPPSAVWEEALSPFMEQPINLLTSITDALDESVFCLKGIDSHNYRNLTHMPRDARGRAACARLALFTGALLDLTYEQMAPTASILTDALYYLCLSAQLAAEQIACSDEDMLWASLDDEESLNDAKRLVALVDGLLERILNDKNGQDDGFHESAPLEVLEALFKRMSSASRGLNANGIYNARALNKIIALSCESGKLDETLGLVESQLASSEIQASRSPLLVSSLVAGMGERLLSSKTIHTMINRSVSDIAGATTRDQHLPLTLVLFTSLCKVYNGTTIPVAQNRVVFAVKQMSSWLEDMEGLSLGLRCQICSALSRLLPEMKDLYGPYWETALLFCINLWEDAKHHDLLTMLPVIYSSLGLIESLESLQSSNEDIQDAFKDHNLAKTEVLIDLLRLPRKSLSPPVDIVDAMLFRETLRIPLAKLPEAAELYPLIASGSRNVQKAAYLMLHRKLPAQQQQMSVDILLDDTDAQIPSALLSLLMDPPALDDFSDEAISQFPATARRYLLAWKLIFAAFSASSLKVRSDYTEQLKTGEHLTPLLTFMFDVLGHSIARPLNLDKEDIGPSRVCDYDITLADAGDLEMSMHWLLAHLYYMTLKHLPGLFRSWFFTCRSKQLKSAVESWTVKFFSPLIIADTLDEVQAWADAQEAPAADEQELVIRTSKAAREVTAGYDVDDSQATIAIAMPPSYPLESVSVTSLNRVAVSERKWQSWILTTQGVITFSNGSIIDGLQVFKRNICGALKGQGECAICYSIISPDRRMPDKRCVTCSNCFHRTCLYKWFQTSNQNTCPLCRNPIDYLGADSAKRRQV